MPYTIIKTSKKEGCEREVIGEYADEAEALECAEAARSGDASNEYEYRVEVPPSLTPPE